MAFKKYILLFSFLFLFSSISVEAFSFDLYDRGTEFIILNWTEVDVSDSVGTFVPYNGAVKNVDLGAYNLTTTGQICDTNGCIGDGGGNSFSLNGTLWNITSSNNVYFDVGDVVINNTLFFEEENSNYRIYVDGSNNLVFED